MMYVSRKARFSASHRLHSKELSDEENRAVFGPCNNPNGHGHNYQVEVVVKGEPDPTTGMIVNLRELKQVLEERVVSEARYRSLDRDVPFMKGRISTTENVALSIWETIAPQLSRGELHLVRVRESTNNVVEYTGPGDT
ncbi:MAG: 6-pyruvoyl tetrahydrobiopterin synthase [Planctomycetes bacterium]|nr:6-pyruvoyl tetrahydrobiopterin synthase [Planctomycetota bacterium]